MTRWIWTLGLAGSLGCGANTSARPVTPEERAEMAAVVSAGNAFAARLHQQLAAEPGNLLHSPFSISTALAMTLAGARGETARQMRAALQLPEDPHGAYEALLDELDGRRVEERWPDDERAGAPAFELAIANALWPQSGYPIERRYVELVRSHYDAAARALDFAGEPEAARRDINRWVEQRTKGRIADLLGPGDLTPDLRLALTNAVYFKAAWDEPFGERGTLDEPFHLASGESTLVPTMHRTDSFAGKAAELVDVVQLPYAGGAAAMILLVPKDIDGLPAVEAALADSLVEWTSGLQPERIALALPRFRFTSRFELNGALRALGMTDAFEPAAADFRGISPSGELFLGLALHQAFVAVDEEGTEAAAATVDFVLAGIDPAEPREVRADRPFLFVIRDEPSGAILFLGRVADPRG